MQLLSCPEKKGKVLAQHSLQAIDDPVFEPWRCAHGRYQDPLVRTRPDQPIDHPSVVKVQEYISSPEQLLQGELLTQMRNDRCGVDRWSLVCRAQRRNRAVRNTEFFIRKYPLPLQIQMQ